MPRITRVYTRTGETARQIASYRPQARIVASQEAEGQRTVAIRRSGQREASPRGVHIPRVSSPLAHLIRQRAPERLASVV